MLISKWLSWYLIVIFLDNQRSVILETDELEGIACDDSILGSWLEESVQGER